MDFATILLIILTQLMVFWGLRKFLQRNLYTTQNNLTRFFETQVEEIKKEIAGDDDEPEEGITIGEYLAQLPDVIATAVHSEIEKLVGEETFWKETQEWIENTIRNIIPSGLGIPISADMTEEERKEADAQSVNLTMSVLLDEMPWLGYALEKALGENWDEKIAKNPKMYSNIILRAKENGYFDLLNGFLGSKSPTKKLTSGYSSSSPRKVFL